MSIDFNSLLPNDCWYFIYEKLDSSDKRSFGLTCHTFLSIHKSSLRCLVLGCTRKPNRCKSHLYIKLRPNLDRLVNDRNQLESLSLGSCRPFNNSDVTAFLRFGSKLHSLYLKNCSYVTDIGLASVATSCPMLSIISLSGCFEVTDDGLEILTKSCISLKVVYIAYCTNITDRGILSLIKNCRQLRSLDVSGCANIVGVTFHGISPSFSNLEARDCWLRLKDVGRIFSGGGIEYLSISYGFNFIKDRGLASIGLGFASNLKILNCEMCRYITNDHISIVSRVCPLLQEWNLSCCGQIWIPGWESIGMNCKNLEKLHVNYCCEICDQGLLALGKGCKRLSVIYMLECFRITTSGIQNFTILRRDVKIKYEEIEILSPLASTS